MADKKSSSFHFLLLKNVEAKRVLENAKRTKFLTNCNGSKSSQQRFVFQPKYFLIFQKDDMTLHFLNKQHCFENHYFCSSLI